ncbi:helix-turn-helix domain-containing protein [Mucilaginibacter phyllosphaerae]
MKEVSINSLTGMRQPDIGLALRKIRLHHEYSQQFVADHLKISRNTYLDWERNRFNLSFKNCLLICSFYGITLSQFAMEYLEVDKQLKQKKKSA